jgi:tripartite-type tricarboxylate transporter receptor subunit TctC
MEKQALKPVYITGKEMRDFLEKDDAFNAGLMKDAGFIAK